MTWTHNGSVIEEPPSGAIGFVYLITNTVTGRMYVGKKLMYNTRHKRIKGRKNRKKLLLESDWKDYTGSSDRLNHDIEELGIESFKREVLHFCKGKGELSYMELREQMDRKVLESDEYYNEWIYVRVRRSHVPVRDL